VDTGYHLLCSNRFIIAPSTLTITLRNQTTSNTVFTHITGIPVDKGGICFMKSDSKKPYYPPSPDANLTPVAEDIAIPLAAHGSVLMVIFWLKLLLKRAP
jgi:hypothetical protein